MSALDARNNSAKAAGTGGLFQVASYWSGLSGKLQWKAHKGTSLCSYVMLGGGWLTGSLALNDWPTALDLVNGNGGNLSGWLLDLDLGTPNGLNIFDDKNQAYFGSILSSVKAKAAKGMCVA
jgi:lysophospholipase